MACSSAILRQRLKGCGKVGHERLPGSAATVSEMSLKISIREYPRLSADRMCICVSSNAAELRIQSMRQIGSRPIVPGLLTGEAMKWSADTPFDPSSRPVRRSPGSGSHPRSACVGHFRRRSEVGALASRSGINKVGLAYGPVGPGPKRFRVLSPSSTKRTPRPFAARVRPNRSPPKPAGSI